MRINESRIDEVLLYVHNQMFGCSCVTDAATAELTQAINECNLSRAYGVIEQLEKLEKSQRVFNVQLDHFGEVMAPVEEPVKDEKINEFRYVCIVIIAAY